MSHDPVWTPDGKRLAFRSWQAGGMTMWLMTCRSKWPASAARSIRARAEPGLVLPRRKVPRLRPEGSADAAMTSWSCPLERRARQPLAVAQSRFGEGSAKFSPDGRWVAYSSTESGRPEVYVQPFPGPGPKMQISNDGGTDPVWRRMGGELYYRSGNKMMAVSVTTSPAFQCGCATTCSGRAPTRRHGLLVRNARGRPRPVTTCRPTASGF